LNRGLLLFSILLIIVGLFVGIVTVPLVGVFLLMLSLVIPGSKRVPPQRGQAPQQRTQASPMGEVIGGVMGPPPAPTVPQYMTVPAAAPTQPSGYEQRASAGSPALFPTPMFPSLVPSQPAMMPMAEAEKKKEGGEEKEPEARDELFELGAILIALRLLSA